MQAHVIPVGNLANQMLQLAVLERLRQRLPDLRIGGVDLPLWQTKLDLPPSGLAKRLRLYGQFVDFDLLSALLERGWIRDFEFAALGFRMDNLPQIEQVRSMFQPRVIPEHTIGAHELLINVRGAETLQNVHEDYGPLPVGYLLQLARSTGLQPVLMGQIGDDWYSDALRRAFQGCRIIPSQGVLQDFEILRGATHVAMSLSTFSWIACWLSAAKTIHMPVIGIFNPLQRPEINLLPASDPRYRFYGFDVRHWTATQPQIRALLEPGEWPRLAAEDVLRRLAQAEVDWQPLRARYRRRLLLATAAQNLRWSSRVGVSR